VAKPELGIDFPTWRRPKGIPKLSPRKMDVFGAYWLLRSEKDRLLSIASGEHKVKTLTRVAATEAENGFWKLSTQTFSEAILQVQRLDKKSNISPEKVDGLWQDVSIALYNAGFYKQALHVLKNMKNKTLADLEVRVLKGQIKAESNQTKRGTRTGQKDRTANKEFHIIVDEATGHPSRSSNNLWEEAYGPGLKEFLSGVSKMQNLKSKS